MIYFAGTYLDVKVPKEDYEEQHHGDGDHGVGLGKVAVSAFSHL